MSEATAEADCQLSWRLARERQHSVPCCEGKLWATAAAGLSHGASGPSSEMPSSSALLLSTQLIMKQSARRPVPSRSPSPVRYGIQWLSGSRAWYQVSRTNTSARYSKIVTCHKSKQTEESEVRPRNTNWVSRGDTKVDMSAPRSPVLKLLLGSAFTWIYARNLTPSVAILKWWNL